MRGACVIRALVAVAGALLAAGCGSIHIGSTTHTHIYLRQALMTDDIAAMQFDRTLQYLRSLVPSEGAPLEGFRWDEVKIREAHERMEEENESSK